MLLYPPVNHEEYSYEESIGGSYELADKTFRSQPSLDEQSFDNNSIGISELSDLSSEIDNDIDMWDKLR